VRDTSEAEMKTNLEENLLQEFRRGNIIMAVLTGLQQERYGFELSGILASHGMEIEEFTLYPLLRRLERQGLLGSQWRVDSNRPKRYYKLSLQGRTLLKKMLPIWRSINASVEAINKEASRAAS
jgi:PadR family transcriptional regulator, regulatory protein PadR